MTVPENKASCFAACPHPDILIDLDLRSFANPVLTAEARQEQAARISSLV